MWLDNSLRFNATVYRMDWEGLRVTKQFAANSGDLVLATVSGGTARAEGYEMDLLYSISDFTLNLGWAVNDTTYIEVGENSPLTPNTPWAFAPKYNGSFGLQYDKSLSGGSEIMLRADYGYQSGYQMDAAIQRQPLKPENAYGIWNARARFIPSEGNWSVSLFATNIKNERYITGGIDAANLWGTQFIGIGQPRMYGLSLNVGFE